MQNEKRKSRGLDLSIAQTTMRYKLLRVMQTYQKRNSGFKYNQSQMYILCRILEVVYREELAFWLFTCLLENILPLDFWQN